MSRARTARPVTRALVAVGYELDDAPLKTCSSRRSIDLDARTVAILIEWRDTQRSWGLIGGPAFTKPDGTRIHPHVFSQTFERVAARADVPTIRLHDLRHTHATLLLKAGVPLKVVSERLGHASPAFTMTTYQHVLPGVQAEAAKTFAALVAASTEINPVDAP